MSEADKEKKRRESLPEWDKSRALPPNQEGPSPPEQAMPHPDAGGEGSRNATETAPPRGPNRKERPQTGILTDMLYLDNRYPVLLAGAAEAGKSTIIISLIHAAARAGRGQDRPIDITMSKKFFRKGKEHVEQKDQEQNSALVGKIDAMQDYADLFFQNARIDFVHARKQLDATQLDVPIVIPLDLTFPDLDVQIKLAIIDGRGEWYEPQIGGKDTKRYRDLPEDIHNLLEQYQRAMSFIWVAPTFEEDDLGAARRCDQGLEAALTHYQDCRPSDSCRVDSHLMLLAKWDTLESAESGRYFERLDGRVVVEQLDALYRLSWDKFCNLPIGANSEMRRKFMQYCAWSFLNGRPIPLDPEFEDAYLRYPRTVLNWILSNAFKLEVRRSGELKETLQFAPFPDVMPSNRQYIPLSNRIIRALT